MPAARLAVHVHGLTAVHRDGSTVLDGLDLDVARGEYLLVAGPAGAGKSTLALALAGMLTEATGAAVEGMVEVDGADVGSADPAGRSGMVAVVRQDPEAQLCRRTVFEEVRAVLDYRMVPAEQSLGTVRAALATVGLGHLDDARDPITLSGGEQQRLALAAAFVQEPQVLVLDEATAHLDPTGVEQFGQALANVRAARQLTVIAIDHRPEFHTAEADRVMVLDDAGHVALTGTPDEVFGAHASACRDLGLRLPADGTGRSAVQAFPRERRPAEDPALAMRDLRVSARGARLLDDVSLDLDLGEIVLVTGHNGAGKSTLLRALAGRPKRPGGSITPARRARIRAGIGYAPQRGGDFLITTTVAEELALAVGGKDDPRARELLERGGLANLTGAHPLRLSAGQRQRLSVLLAVAATPPLVLLDEPTSAQDARGTAAVLDLLTVGADDRLTLIATHDPEVFTPCASRHLVLRGGHIEDDRTMASAPGDPR